MAEYKPEILEEKDDYIKWRSSTGDPVITSKKNQPDLVDRIKSKLGFSTGADEELPMVQTQEAPPTIHAGQSVPAAAEPGETAVAPVAIETPQVTAPALQMKTGSQKEITKETKTVSPEARAFGERAYQANLEAVAHKAEAERNQAVAQAKASAYQARVMDKEMQRINEEDAAREARRAEMMDEITKRQKEYEGMAVDPNRYFADKSTFAKVMMAIGIGLGAYAQSWEGRSSNSVMDIINGAINRDIEAQKANISKAGEALSARRGAYQDFLSLTRDKKAAQQAEWDRQMGLVEKKVNAYLESSKNPLIKANAEALKAQIMNERAKNMAELEQSVTRASTKQDVEMATPKSETAKDKEPLKGQPDEQRAAVEEGYDALKQLEELKKVVNTGPVKDVQNRIAAFFGIDSVDPSELRAATKKLVAKATKAEFGGNASDKDRQAIEDASLSPGLSDKVFDARLKNSRAALVRKYNQMYQAYSPYYAIPMSDAGRELLQLGSGDSTGKKVKFKPSGK